jgi:predicted nuclease of restriction endonuclease-like RecB superfamily
MKGDRIVLVENMDARRKDLIEEVLQTFKKIGASKEELERECYQLNNDNNYFSEWILCLPNWHDSGRILICEK